MIQFLHSTFVYSLNIYASVLVLFSLCISHMVIIDTYIVFDCSLFLLLLFFSFIVIRCEMSLVKFSNEMWWKMCDSSGARTVLSTTKPIYCSVLHTHAAHANVRTGYCDSSMEYEVLHVCVGARETWVETNKTEFFNRFFVFYF